MVLCLRKFLNLLLTFVLFDNIFTRRHFLAIIMVVLGTIEFYDGFSKIIKKCFTSKRSEEERQKKKKDTKKQI